MSLSAGRAGRFRAAGAPATASPAEYSLRRTFTDLLAREPFVLLVLAVDAVVLTTLLPGLVGSDTWLALLGGRYVSENWIPHHDSLAIWSDGTRWVDQQWLGQLVMYGEHAAGGLRLVLVAHLLVLIGSLALALTFARRSGGSARSVGVIGTAAALVALQSSAARTQALAYPLFIALFWLLSAQVKRPGARVFLALPLLVLWANIHGSAVLGAGLVVAWSCAELIRAGRRPGLGRKRVRAVALAVAAPLCLLVSPYGLDLVGYYHDVLGADAFRDVVTEWSPSTFPGQWPFFALAAGALWLTARRPSRLSLFEHLALLVTGLAALDAIRNIVWFALVVLLVVPRALDGVWKASEAPIRTRVNTLLSLGVLTLIAVSLAVAAAKPYSWYTRSYPAGALASVERATAGDPSLRVFANERYADWLLWKLPSLSGRIAFDARLELLTGDRIRSVADFRRRSPRMAAADGFGLLVLDARRERPAIRVALRSGARPLYRDRDVVVLLREASP
jgi:hypothetical protein